MPTMYDRGESSKDPKGASGSYNLRGDQKGHSTQYYDDNTRVSWDTDGKTDSDTGRHWTNQSKAKGSTGRHTPPSHASRR